MFVSMEIHYPTLPRIYCVGSFAATPQPLSWLAEITQLRLESSTEVLANPSRLADAHLILIDADLPESQDLCIRLKRTVACEHLPLLGLSQMDCPATAERLMKTGVTDYISAPVSRELFLARIQAQVHLQAVLQLMRDRSAARARKQRLPVQASASLSDATIHGLAVLIEARSPRLRHVNLRLQRYIEVLAHQAQHVHSDATGITPDLIDLMVKSAPLQQLGTFDAVALDMSAEYLNSPSGKCSQAIRSAQILNQIEERHQQSIGLLQTVKDMLFFQQEHWDGSGMPMGLSGRDIPMAARVLSVVNAYEEIVGDRIALAPFLHQQACEHIEELSGTIFDPDLVTAFSGVAHDFMQIAMQHGDQRGRAPETRDDAQGVRPLFPDIAEETSRARAGQAILRELDDRVSKLPDQVALFVMALVANTTLLPKRLSDYMRMRLTQKNTIELGPVHYSFSKMVNSHLQDTSTGKGKYMDDVAMLQACGGSSAAIQALHFIMNLATIPIGTKSDDSSMQT